jgi:hypothetical protein
MKKFALVLPVMLVAMTIGLTYAQEPAAPDTPAVSEDSVFVIVCDAKPSQWLVLDSTGKWVSGVRSVEVTLTIGSATPTVKGTLWSGPIKPKNPQVKTWKLVQLKSVTEAEFQEMLDSLQTDSDAIRRRVTGE